MHRRGQRGLQGFNSSHLFFKLCVQAAPVLIKSYILPVSRQIDIRIAKFLENFMWSENYICTLFENKADSNLKKIFSVRGKRPTMSLQL